MTRLEQLDSYLTLFSSTISDIRREGGKVFLALEQSAFYPTSGGQLHDTGTLNGIGVVDVFKDDKIGDTVWHQVAEDFFQVGDKVTGMINWTRRYRHMQRHTAQHLLSQTFLQVNPLFETKAVSLTNATCTVDIAGEASALDLATAEEFVNDIVYRALPITAFEVDEKGIGNYPLRRPPKVSGTIRLVKMGDFELSACGGTHLRNSAEAAPIKLLSSERIKGNLTRVYFRAGLEALEDYRHKHDISTSLAQSFSSQVDRLPERVQALRDELRERNYQLTLLQEMLASQKAQELLQTAQQNSGKRIISCELSQAESMLLQPLAKLLTAHNDVIALLGTTTDKASLLFARGKNVQTPMNKLLADVLYLIQGKGGGSPERAQGNGADVSGLTQALEYARILASNSAVA